MEEYDRNVGNMLTGGILAGIAMIAVGILLVPLMMRLSCQYWMM